MIQLPKLNRRPGLVHGFSDASDGNMDFRFGQADEILVNQERFLARLGLSLDQGVRQYGLDEGVVVVGAKERGTGMVGPGGIEANAMISIDVGTGLFLTIADCLPVIVYDPRVRVAAMMHAARNSTNLRLPSKLVRQLSAEFGSKPADLVVAFGPCIRAESYTFDDGIYQLVDEHWKSYLRKLPNGRIAVDNVSYVRDQLIEAGVPADQIEDCGIDTGTNEHFFSHVRSVRTGEPEQRFAAVVAMV